MKAKNIGNSVLRLESGELEVGAEGEVTNKEYAFLRAQGRLGNVIIDDKKPQKSAAPKPAPIFKKAAKKASTGA